MQMHAKAASTAPKSEGIHLCIQMTIHYRKCNINPCSRWAAAEQRHKIKDRDMHEKGRKEFVCKLNWICTRDESACKLNGS